MTLEEAIGKVLAYPFAFKDFSLTFSRSGFWERKRKKWMAYADSSFGWSLSGYGKTPIEAMENLLSECEKAKGA